MGKNSSAVRPGIVPGEVLTVKDFCFRANLQRYAWSSLLRDATKAGYPIALKQGRAVFVDTGVWLQYLKETQSGGTRRARSSRKQSGSRQVDTEAGTAEGVAVGDSVGRNAVSLETA